MLWLSSLTRFLSHTQFIVFNICVDSTTLPIFKLLLYWWCRLQLILFFCLSVCHQFSSKIICSARRYASFYCIKYSCHCAPFFPGKFQMLFSKKLPINVLCTSTETTSLWALDRSYWKFPGPSDSCWINKKLTDHDMLPPLWLFTMMRVESQYGFSTNLFCCNLLIIVR